jgi:hypothetical protein
MAPRTSSSSTQGGRERKEKASPETALSPPQALYLYCITASDAKKPKLQAEGIDGSAGVEAREVNGFLCWVSRVSRAEFADALSERMQDLEWLSAAGVRHQRVVAELARHSTALPARFGTIFLTEKSLAEDVAHRKAELNAALQKISGADEWGIKIFRLAEPIKAAVPGETGSAYLERKAKAMQPRERAVAPEVKQFAESLEALAREVAPGGSITQGQPALEWQTSILLPRTVKPKFDAAIQRFARDQKQKYRIEVTGPWPPYSFVKHG